MLTERMDSVRSVALGFWFRQGRVHEDAAESGVSHLLEHMVFKGTGRRSARDLAWEIERLGGALDAYTTHEATAFQARVPSEHLDVAVEVLTDLCFGPLLRPEDFELERGVVLEEIAALEDVPEDVVFDLQASFLYAGHPYGESIVGTRASVSSMTLDALRRVHAAWYRPANLIVAAAGAIDHDRLLELLDRHLPTPDADAPPRPAEAPTGAVGERRVERPGAHQTHIVTGALSVPYRDPLRYALVVVSTALGAGMSSRLFQRVREELGLAYSVYSFHCFFASGGHVGAYVGTRPEATESARNVLDEELSSLAAEGLRQDELEDTREQLKGQMLIALESPASRMNRLAGIALYDRPYLTLDEVAREIDAVDRDAVARASAFFHPDRTATLSLVPACGG